MPSLQADAKKEETSKKQPHSGVESKKLLLLPVDKAKIQLDVLTYFSESAYYTAFVAFKKEINSTFEPSPLLKEREEIRIFAADGKFLKVLAATQKLLPCLLFNTPGMAFEVIKQDILEDMYIRNSSEGSALVRIEKELSPIVLDHPDLLPNLEDLVSSILFGESSQEEVIIRRDAIFTSINQLLLMSVDYVIQNSITSLLMGISSALEMPEITTLSKNCKMLHGILESLTS
ncbi:hypothetical protein NEAUS03_2197 [Nematocida ausubeli]|nr:hypothetical protein NEAUS03_2197 [Nematocida ausubeli]